MSRVDTEAKKQLQLERAAKKIHTNDKIVKDTRIQGVSRLFSGVEDEFETLNMAGLLAHAKHGLTFERKKAAIASLLAEFEQRIDEFSDNVRNRLTSEEHKILSEAKKVIRALVKDNPSDRDFRDYKTDLRLSTLESRDQRSILNQVKYSLAISYDAIVAAIQAVVDFVKKVGNAIKTGAIWTKDVITACAIAVGNAVKSAAIAVWDFMKFVGSTIKNAAIAIGTATANTSVSVANAICHRATALNDQIGTAIHRTDGSATRGLAPTFGGLASFFARIESSLTAHADRIDLDLERAEAPRRVVRHRQQVLSRPFDTPSEWILNYEHEKPIVTSEVEPEVELKNPPSLCPSYKCK